MAAEVAEILRRVAAQQFEVDHDARIFSFLVDGLFSFSATGSSSTRVA
jgi:hypothetical protein